MATLTKKQKAESAEMAAANTFMEVGKEYIVTVKSNPARFTVKQVLAVDKDGDQEVVETAKGAFVHVEDIEHNRRFTVYQNKKDLLKALVTDAPYNVTLIRQLGGDLDRLIPEV